MLRCIATYRNITLGIYVEPGEVLRDLTPEQEEHLLRDSPGSFEEVASREVKALDTPPRHKMIEREQAARKDSERIALEPMTGKDHRGTVFPKG